MVRFKSTVIPAVVYLTLGAVMTLHAQERMRTCTLTLTTVCGSSTVLQEPQFHGGDATAAHRL